jgi:hypothetical protein
MDNRWTAWHDSLPKHTQEYLKDAQIWTDNDMAKFCAFSFAIGLLIGAIAVWH